MLEKLQSFIMLFSGEEIAGQLEGVQGNSGSGFSKIFGNVLQWVADFQLAGTAAILVIGILMIVVPLIVGTQQQKEQAKNRVFGFIIGTVILLGVFNIAALIARNVSF